MYNFNEVQTQRNIRTKFTDTHNHKTTFNTGDLIPIYYKEILPGDEVKLSVKALTKMTTPNFQTMDCAFQDIQFYFVPRRLLWEHWKNFQGERNVGPHDTQPEYTIPQVTSPSSAWYKVVPVTAASFATDGTCSLSGDGYLYTYAGGTYTKVTTGSYSSSTTYYGAFVGWDENTIADYFGVPTKVGGLSIDASYFRAYCLVWNEWFRDQNRQDFTDFSTGDSTVAGSNGTNYVTDPIKGGAPLKVAKIHDYFTSSLLTPTGSQKVTLPLGTIAPVVKTGTMYFSTDAHPDNTVNVFNGNSGSVAASNGAPLSFWNIGPAAIAQGENLQYKSGLSVDLANATAATVNQLRMAFQLQKIFEANNRSGSRYIEQLRNRWNVIPSDATLQRPEYLGGKRIPLNIQMVVQTSSTDSTSPLGQIAGFSNTYDENTYFSQKFEEHGILLGLTCVRHQRTYQQGLSKFFTRKNMEDFYMPEFQNIGEQPVYNYEIYAQGSSVVDTDGNIVDDKAFGYQEYGAEYRFTPNRVTGQFRSNARNSFDNWHYADDYSSLPVNNDDWIVENPTAVDRTLTLASTSGINQFYSDFQFIETEVRTMPPHSIPGFIDHH